MTILNQNYPLPAGHTLAVTVLDGNAHVRQNEDTTVAAFVTNTTPASFGPYFVDKSFRVQHGGNATVTIAEAETAVPARSDPGDVIELFGAAAPTAAAQATANVNPTGDDNGLTFTAVEYGAGGNQISVAYVDPGANDASLSVSVTGKAISVSLATGSGGSITSTAADILAAIEAHDRANDLVTVAVMTSDSGSEDDGSGVVTAMAATLLTGGAGTGVGTAGKGSRYTDTSGGAIYLNTGTKAQPVWTELTQES